MNIADVIIIAVVLVLFILSVIYINRNGTCTSNCEGCHGACSAKHRQNKTPNFVEAYRRDHPKEDK